MAALPVVEMFRVMLMRIESEFTPLEPPAAGEVNLAGLRRLVALDALKSVNSAIEKKLAELRAPLEQEMLVMFETIGTNNFNIDGRTVYLHREWWAKAKGDLDAAVKALRTYEQTNPFVKESFNTQTVSAYFRERRLAREEVVNRLEAEAAEKGLPFDPEDNEAPPIFPTKMLADTLEFSEKTSVRSRSAGGK